jgi:hypothetical protein
MVKNKPHAAMKKWIRQVFSAVYKDGCAGKKNSCGKFFSLRLRADEVIMLADFARSRTGATLTEILSWSGLWRRIFKLEQKALAENSKKL